MLVTIAAYKVFSGGTQMYLRINVNTGFQRDAKYAIKSFSQDIENASNVDLNAGQSSNTLEITVEGTSLMNYNKWQSY